MEREAGSGFQSGKPALCAMIEAGGRCITDFSFPPVFCPEYGLHAYGGIRVGFHAGIFGSGYMVDEQVVIAALKVEMWRTLLFVKQLLAVQDFARCPYTGFRQAQTEATHGSEQIVERYALVQPALPRS